MNAKTRLTAKGETRHGRKKRYLTQASDIYPQYDHDIKSTTLWPAGLMVREFTAERRSDEGLLSSCSPRVIELGCVVAVSSLRRSHCSKSYNSSVVYPFPPSSPAVMSAQISRDRDKIWAKESSKGRTFYPAAAAIFSSQSKQRIVARHLLFTVYLRACALDLLFLQ